MKNVEIIQVSYGKTINIGNFENIRVDLVAKVPPDKTYEQVLDGLKRIMADEEHIIRTEEKKLKRTKNES